MRTLIVTLDLAPAYTGGIASWVDDLARALLGRGEGVEVLAQATGETTAWDQAQPYAVHRMHGRSWGSWQGVWAVLAGQRRLRDARRILFATWPLATWLGPAARARGLTVGLAFHGSDLTRLEAPNAGFQRAVGAAHALLPVSEFLRAELRRLGVDGGRIQPLPMPLPLPASPGPRGESLLCVARLTPLKGVDRAIRLAARLGRPLLVVGDGPARAELEQAARGTATTFLGRRTRDEIRALPAVGAVLLPRAEVDGSGAEGLGLTLIEAAARGLPTLGCRTGGVPEAVGPGLVLSDPDAPTDDEIRRVQDLLHDEGAPARFMAWARAQHGPGPCLAALETALAEGPSHA